MTHRNGRYIALQHSELAVDMVVEDDFGATLNSYTLIVLTDTHVSTTASKGLAAWVAAGGTLLATAGAGAFDEMNKTNAVMTKLLGIGSNQGTYEPGDDIQFIKQDLVNASIVGEVTFEAAAAAAAGGAGAGNGTNVTMPAVAVRQMFTPATTATVIATWNDTKKSAAAVHSVVGKGQVFYYAFHPGFSYFLPALPVRPTDRGGLDTAYVR